jgi:hypothetical protein
MFTDETQEVDLETSTEEAEEDTVTVEDTEEEEKGVEYWKAEALKNKAILERNKGKEVKEAKPQSDDFDYGQYAFMEQRGIESDDDISFVKKSMKDSGKSLREVLNANWFKSELKERHDLSKTEQATIKGKRSGGASTDSVEYWASKDFADVPQNMRGKVLAHREAKEKNKGMFYNT